MKLKSTYLAVICSLFILTQGCGDQSGISGQVGVNIFPTNPQVFDTDTTANEGTTLESAVSGAWFKFQLQIVNNSSKTIWINPITIEAFGFKGGTQSSAASETIEAGFFERQSTPFSISPGADETTSFQVYVGGLPKVSEGNVDSKFFRVTGTIEGFTGVSNTEPEDNIAKQFQFTTKSN